MMSFKSLSWGIYVLQSQSVFGNFTDQSDLIHKLLHDVIHVWMLSPAQLIGISYQFYNIILDW